MLIPLAWRLRSKNASRAEKLRACKVFEDIYVQTVQFGLSEEMSSKAILTDSLVCTFVDRG